MVMQGRFTMCNFFERADKTLERFLDQHTFFHSSLIPQSYNDLQAKF